MAEDKRTVRKDIDVDSAKNQQAAIMNEEGMRNLVKVITAEMQSMFTPEFQSALDKARADVRKSEASNVLSAVESDDDAFPPKKREIMTPEQIGEWLLCTLSPSPRSPRKQLDQDGIITSWLPGGKLMREMQALAPGTASAGGYLIPDDWQADLIKRAAEPDGIWERITKRTTKRESVTQSEVSDYVTVNQGTSAKSQSATSSDEISETEPTFTEMTWTMRYFDAVYRTKIDMIEDSPVDVINQINEIIADAFKVKREYHPLRGAGSGSSLPQGLMDSGAGITEVDVSDALTVSNLLGFMSNVPQRYRKQATLVVCSQIMFDAAEELASNIRSAQFLTGMLPPFMESAYMPTNKILAGDLSKYVVYINRLMYMMTSDNASTFSKIMTFVEKWDGQPTITDAFRIGTSVTY